MGTVAYIAVGSNIDPESNIALALKALNSNTHVKITAVSTFYKTLPIGTSESPEFINGMFELDTTIAPKQLKFDILRNIEADLGRVRTEDRYAPRQVDLDLILYGRKIIRDAELDIPDPDIIERHFVGTPLFELAPNLVLPDSRQKLRDLPVTKPGPNMRALLQFSSELKRTIENEQRKSC